MIFIGLELTGLSLYVIWGSTKPIHSAEAGLKYFLFGSTASAFTLFGLSLVYGMCGTPLPRSDLLAGAIQPLLFAGSLTLIGFAFKIAAAPFHLWVRRLPGAPIPSAAFIASAEKCLVRGAGKNLLVGFGPARERGMARCCRLGAGAWHWRPVHRD
jgi:NADH-quinone oxidoreductase subunit N